VGAVVVSDLRVRFGDLAAVDGVSFSVGAGETVVVLGPNGAGKTTTIETVEGHRRPASGLVRVLGFDPVGEARALRPRMGVMLQDGGVYPGIRPLEALRLFASYYPNPADPAELLARVGLAARVRTPWRRLSGGEQQRLSLALALVGRPEVAFLDEPTAGVDVEGRRGVRDLIGGLRDDGVTVVVTTHDLDEAERLADRIVILDGGRVVADGTAAELRTAADVDDIAFAAEAGLDVGALGGVLGARVTEVAPGEYVASAAPTPANVATVTGWLAEHGVALGELRGSRRRLEDVFLRLTGGDAKRDER
jgi:ABC-2 type transport system ATP-binding protein